MDLEERITFYQNDLPLTSFGIFQHMRLNGELCDLTIKVQNMTFTAHRLVLAAGIPYFRSVFGDNALDVEKNEMIGMEKVDCRALESLIEFAYTSKVDISLENVQSLLVASEFLQLTIVKDACVEFLSKRIFVDNVLQVCTLAHNIKNAELIESVNRYFRKNFEEFSKSDNFSNLSPSRFVEIISSDNLCVSGEETVFEAVINWVKASPSERKGLLPQLLNEVRLIFVPTSYLIKRVAAEELIRNSAECRDLVENVKNFHLLPKEEASLLNLKTRLRTNKFPAGIYAITWTEDLGMSVYKCDILERTWEKLISKPKQKTSIHCTASTREDIYLFFEETVEKINLPTGQWETLKLRHNGIFGAVALSHEKMIYVLFCYQSFSNDVRCFDILEPKWLKKGKLKSCHWYPAAAALEESIYVTGGYKDQLCANAQNSVEKYCVLTGKSTKVADMCVSRAQHGCASMNGKIYVCGGFVGKGAVSNSAEVYDPVTDRWTSLRPVKINRRFSMLSYNEKIYSLGSMLFRDPWDFEVYDPETGEWEYEFRTPAGFQVVVSISSS